MWPDDMSTGFSGAESGHVQFGDAVAIFTQGPIGLCATAAARLMGATTIIGVEVVLAHIEIAHALGVDSAGNLRRRVAGLAPWRDPLLARVVFQRSHDSARCIRGGLGDHEIVTTPRPGGKERMRRLMETIASERLDTRQLVAHRFELDQIADAYELFADPSDGVLKVAITPSSRSAAPT